MNKQLAAVCLATEMHFSIPYSFLYPYIHKLLIEFGAILIKAKYQLTV